MNVVFDDRMPISGIAESIATWISAKLRIEQHATTGAVNQLL
jgi:hypothetical protein